MSTDNSASIVSKVWNYPPSLRYGRAGNPIPDAFAWSELSSKSGDDLEPSGARETIPKDRPEGWRGDELEVHYRHTLENLGKAPGLVGIIFRKAQNKIANPSDLQRVIKMIADEDWSGMDVDIKGAIYEGLLEKTASSSDSPTGIFYAQGVKANVLFFDRKEASETPWTKDLWIYDLRTNQHFTLKTNPLAPKDLTDFVKCYGNNKAGKMPALHKRKETDRFKKFTYDEIVARDKANLDIFWLKDESLEDTENLPPPVELAAEIVASLEVALEEFRGVEDALAKTEEQ